MRSSNGWRQMRFNQLRRREFVALLGGAAVACPLSATGQQAKKVWRIGCIVGGSSLSSGLDGIPEGMRELGHAEGKDFVIEWRYAEGNYERIPNLVAELARLPVDILVLTTG